MTYCIVCSHKIEGKNMYDLTSVLTTISAAAASFVAILGGFIASKLLSISGEREAVNERLDNLNNDLVFLNNDNSRLQAELDKDDAKSFILDHINNLINNDTIEECYPTNEQTDISLETLSPYWVEALELMTELRTALGNKEKLNSDKIPNSLATKYLDDYFSYTILKGAVEEIGRMPLSGFALYDHLKMPRVVGMWRNDNYKAIEENNKKIANLKYEMEKLTKKKEMLRSPKGVKLGLYIFGMFSLLCIILPLCFSPLTTDNYKYYLSCKIMFITIFAIGLLSVFIYLIYLLKWQKANKSKLNNKRK